MEVVAITGASGTIGRHLVDALKPSVGQVRVLLLPGEPIPACCERAIVYRGDIRRPEDLSAFLDGADTVFHLAALVGKDARTFAEARAVNVDGTRNLVELAKARGTRRFVLLSTCSVYGLYGVKDEILDEKAPRTPPNRPYDRSKTEAEIAVTDEDPAKLSWSVLQIPVALGGAHTVDKPNLLSHIRLARTGFIPCPLGYRAWANFAYAGDVATALIRLGVDRRSTGEVFIFGEAVPLDELFTWIARELNSVVRMIPVPGFALRLAAPVSNRAAVLANRRRFSSDKIRSILGYSPGIGLEQGLRITISHYRSTGLIA